MNVALPTLPAASQATGGADSGGLPPVAAVAASTLSGGVFDLPLFIDVLSKVLPSSVLAPVQPEQGVATGEMAQDAPPAVQEPALDSALAEGVDTGQLPAAWEQGAWSTVFGGAARVGEPEDEKPKRGGDADALSADGVSGQAGQAAVVPWQAAPLPFLASSQLGVMALQSAHEGIAAGAAGPAQQVVSPAAQGVTETITLASMAPALVRQPDATPASALPPVDSGSAAPVFEPVDVPTLSDRGAALVQGANALVQVGDGSQPLTLNPRQPDLWQRPLAQALGERLQVQGAQGEEQALIRLDPPSLGRVEIVLRQEGGTWQVQLSATHPEVTRQLQAISETLRHELSVRQQASVTVQVTSDHLGLADGRQQRQRQDGQQPREPGRAWDGDEAAQTFDLA